MINIITNKITIILVSRTFSHICKCSMMSSRCIYAMRAMYHGLNALTNSNVMEQTNKKNHTALAKSLVDYSMDKTQGVPQHKESMLTHIISHRFQSAEIFDVMQENYLPILKYESNVLIDPRFTKELYTIKVFHDYFKDDIDWILATNDARAANFPHQTQTNQDWWVNLKIMSKIDKMFGLKTDPISYKVVPHDEKAGTGMFDHTTRGTLGILSYDTPTNQIVQITKKAITSDDIIDFNKNRLRGIVTTMETDRIDSTFCKDIIEKHKANFNTVNKAKFQDVINAHDACQQDLWSNIHLNDNYKRSISFVFFDPHSVNCTVDDMPKVNAFRNRFITLLPDRLYNLDKKSDLHLVERAALQAYKEEVDPLIIQKLMFLQNNGVIFNNNFLQILFTMSKLSP